MSFYRIEEIWKWGEDRGLYEHSTFEAQVVKLIEEAGELLQAINANDREGVKDAIGDCMVVIGHLVRFRKIDCEHVFNREGFVTGPSAFSSWCMFLFFVSKGLHCGRSSTNLMNIQEFHSHIRFAISYLDEIADHFSLSLKGCIDHVIPIINARTGKFNEHGIWVKDTPPVTESAENVGIPPTQPLTSLSVQYGGNHYKNFAIEPAQFLIENRIRFAEGNAIKYLARHEAKGRAEDVKKAIHYSQMVLESTYGIKSTFQVME